MTARLVAIVVRPAPGSLTIAMQRRFWSHFAKKRRHLRLVTEIEAR